MTNEAPPPRLLPVGVTINMATGERMPVTDALIDPETSPKTAAYMKHGQPGEAVVRYYVPDNKADFSETLKVSFEKSLFGNKWSSAGEQLFLRDGDFTARMRKAIDIIRSDAPALDAISDKQLRGIIENAVADLNGKLAGTIRLVPTNSPEQADITLVGVRNLKGDALGQTNDAQGKKMVFVSLDDLKSNPLISRLFHDISHELGHALGLVHPHDATEHKPSSLVMQCTDTAMAYKLLCIDNNGIPNNGLGIADIEALKKLYADNAPTATPTHGLPAAPSTAQGAPMASR